MRSLNRRRLNIFSRLTLVVKGDVMIKSKRLVVLVILSVFGLVTSQVIAAEAPKSVKVGLMFGLTGAASVIGPVQLDGAKLAIQEEASKARLLSEGEGADTSESSGS